METSLVNSTASQNIANSAEVAVSRLQSEARYFEQLAKQFPAYKRLLGKHATDCRQVANNILKKFQFGSPEVLATSVRTANVFVTEGRRLRLKFRIGLLQQEATGLELEAHRMPGLEAEFKLQAEECRRLVSVCKKSISTGSSSETEELLETATVLYDKSLELRNKQKQQRRQSAVSRLQQRIDLFRDKADELGDKNTLIPSASNKYSQLSTHCLHAAARLEGRIEKSSFNEIEKSITTADNFIERIKQSQIRAELSEQRKYEEKVEIEVDEEVSIDNVVPIRELDPAESEPLDEVTESDRIEPDPFYEISDQEVIYEKPAHVSLRTRMSQTASFFKPVLLSLSGYLAVTFQKTVKFIERIFMFLIAGLVIVTIVFVLTYLSGSGFSNIGLF